MLESVCVVLVYSLLETNFEGRTFDMAVFRMFGMRNFEMTVLLMCQGLSYAVVAYPTAMVTVQVIAVFLSEILRERRSGDI